MLFIAERVSLEKLKKPCLQLDHTGTIVIDNPADSMYFINNYRKEIIACVRKVALVAGINYTSFEPLVLNLKCKHVVFGSMIKPQIVEQMDYRSFRLKLDPMEGSHTIILNESKKRLKTGLLLN